MRAFDELQLTGRLPSPPGVGMAIIKMTEGEDHEIGDVARVIRSDPALAGRVLKLCNIGSLAGVRPITSIDEGIQRLGVKALRGVALGFSLIAKYREGACENFDFTRFWSESLARAIAARLVAEQSEFPDPADAYACGLLSGIGRLALACVHPDRYARILTRPEARSSDGLLALEKETFEIDSRELTAALLRDWGIPEHMVIASTTRRRSEDGLERVTVELGRIVSIAAAIGRICIQGIDVDDTELGILEEARGEAAMDRVEFNALCDGVAGEWRDWGSLLELPTAELPTFASFAAPTSLSEDPDDLGLQGERPVRPLRILAADDERVSLRLLVRSLQSFGHEVIEAHDGEEALSLALEHLPDIVVSDFRMPKLGGLEFVRSLRRCEEGRQLYFLMLTGVDDENLVIESFEAGIDDYVLKPFNPRILKARVCAGERVVRMQQQLVADRRRVRLQMSELAVLNRRLEQASLTDHLTGLPNRRFALDKLQVYWAEASRHGDEVAAIMIDIDHFKSVNDRFGHDVGDEVLRRTAAVLDKGVRKDEFVSRLGGEEFLVICHRASLEDAELCAERLRRMVSENQISFGGFEGAITISLGVAATKPPVESYEALLRAADEAVYTAKRSGRDRVCSTRSGALV